MSAVTVLIVEDDANIRNMYADAFDAAGINVLTAENGKDGVDLALKHHPDAILMDIMMPVMGGHEAVNLIKKTPWGMDAKIIYLTNMTDAENVVTAVSQGGLKYIIKANMTPKEVVNDVRMVMKK